MLAKRSKKVCAPTFFLLLLLSLDDEVGVSTIETTPAALARGLKTCGDEDKTGTTLESLTSDPEGLPGFI